MSAYNVGNPGSIPGSGRSSGEGKGNPLQYSCLGPVDRRSLWATGDSSLVAQTVKCLFTMWETQVQSLGREDPLEKEMATHSSTLAWKIPWMESMVGYIVHGVAKSQTCLSDLTSVR